MAACTGWSGFSECAYVLRYIFSYDDLFYSCTGIQEKLGIMNNGAVYAVFDFKAENQDELDMHIGDMFTILKKGDEQEKEWWWARMGTKEGYIPRNLLGVRIVKKCFILPS